MNDLNFELDMTTGEALASDLSDRLEAALPALDQLHESSHALRSLGVEVDLPSLRDAFYRVIGRFLKDLEDRLTREHCHGTTAVADLQSDFGLSKPKLFDIIGPEPDGQEAIGAILRKFPFDGLAKSARLQAVSLHERGLQKSADKLAQDLHLIDYGNWGRNDYIKVKSGRLTFKYSFGTSAVGLNYSWNDERDVAELATHFRVLECEMGDLGLADGFAQCARKLSGERYASGSQVLSCQAVSFVAFNHHMDVRFTQEGTDMLLAFLKLHSSRSITDITEGAHA